MPKSMRGMGTSPVGLLGLAFVALKLTGQIDWSWWWVTCPYWTMCLLRMILFNTEGSRDE